ncbi:glycosyltransferase family 1 protein [Paenibacillus sp. TRM 82003]|nr:glycosyltransferase family 1 protein [Paenibacillus sp. TRM 82003]
MRILHLPMEVGGQIGELIQQLRRLGHRAVGYNWRHVYLKYDNSLLHSDAYEMANSFETAIDYFDIFHYHTGYTLFKDKSDIERVIDAGKKVVMHHRGNDVRIPSLAAKGAGYENPYVYTGDSLPEERIKRNLEYFAKHVSTAIVQDYELYDYVSSYYRRIHILPRPINIERIKPPETRIASDRPIVVHAPTSRSFKGTEDIVRVAEQVSKEIPFDFVLLEKLPKETTLAYMGGADIVIDQINCGMYGNVSVEAMALGKSVICYLRPDIQARLPKELPIVSANRDTLYDELKRLVKKADRRKRLGSEGRAFVEKHHDSRIVAKQLVSIYKKL